MSKAYVLLIGVLLVVYNLHGFYSKLPIPVEIVENQTVTKTEKILRAAGAPEQRIPVLAPAIVSASDATDNKFSPPLIVALMKTESEFKKEAVSSKGYKGEMQTQWASEYSDVNILFGTRVLETKYRIAKGDIKLALALYKGGNNPLAKRYATKTLALYNTLARVYYE